MRLVLCALLASSCAAPYLTAQRGHVTPRGKVRTQLSAAGGVATSAVGIVRDARDFEKSITSVDCSAPGGKCYRKTDFRPLVDGGLQLALFGPASFDPGGSVRYGYAERLDAGASLLGSGYRLDAGWQVLGDPAPDAPGWAAALYLGWNHHRSPLGAFLDKVHLSGFGRDDLDVLAVASRPLGSFFQVALGARYMLSRWTVDLSPSLPIVDEQLSATQFIPDTDTRGLIHQYGVSAALVGGYRYFYLGAELNLVAYHAGARLLGEQRHFGGVVLYPGVYVFGPY